MGKMKLTGRERITISIPSDLKSKGLEEANRLGISFSGVVSVALTYYFSTNAIANSMPDVIDLVKQSLSEAKSGISLEPSRYDSKGKEQGEALNLLDVLSKNLNSDEKESEGR